MTIKRKVFEVPVMANNPLNQAKLSLAASLEGLAVQMADRVGRIKLIYGNTSNAKELQEVAEMLLSWADGIMEEVQHDQGGKVA